MPLSVDARRQSDDTPGETEDYSPFAVLEYMESQVSEVRPASFDSVKYNLLERYVKESATIGIEGAYDSLSKRAMRYLYTSPTGVTTSDVENPDDIELESYRGEKEVERLRRENDELRRQIQSLEYRNKQSGVRVVSSEQQKNDEKWAAVVARMTGRRVDSMTISMLRNRDKVHLPLCYDSISSDVFAPHFMSSKGVRYRSVENVYDSLLHQRELEQKVNQRILLKLAETDPTAIAYYDLQEYIPFDYAALAHGSSHLDENNTVSQKLTDINIRTKKAKAEAWESMCKVSASLVNYYVSKWASGGKNYASLYGNVEYGRNYKKNRVLWENNLSLDLGFLYSEVDTIHPFRVNEDETNLRSTFGYKFKNSEKLLFACEVNPKTHLFTSYDSYNSSEANSSFLSPTNIFMGAGMWYKHSKNIECLFFPVCDRVFWIIGKRLVPEDYGLKADKTANLTWGYRFRSDLSWNFNKLMKVATEIDAFVPYNPVQHRDDLYVIWTLDGKFTINRFVSVQLVFKMFFDRRVKSKYRDFPQIQERTGFNFAFTF